MYLAKCLADVDWKNIKGDNEQNVESTEQLYAKPLCANQIFVLQQDTE